MKLSIGSMRERRRDERHRRVGEQRPEERRRRGPGLVAHQRGDPREQQRGRGRPGRRRSRPAAWRRTPAAAPSSADRASGVVWASDTLKVVAFIVSTRSTAASTCSGADPRQAPEVARYAAALIARPARQRTGVHHLGASRGSRHGRDRSGSVGPSSATIGVGVVEATCSGPLSPPMYTAARAMSARSSLRSQSSERGQRFRASTASTGPRP